MDTSTIIFLNGVSSSGKTTVARALQAALPGFYLHLSIDRFMDMLPERITSAEVQAEQPLTPPEIQALTEMIPRVVTGMHHCIVALAANGLNLIVDHVLQDPAWTSECAQLLERHRVLLVGVHCPLAELERREQQRDRESGTAKRQLQTVHAHGVYDVEVDTSTLSSDQCARRIIAVLNAMPDPTAFAQIRARLAAAGG